MHENRWRIMHVVNLGTFISTLDVGIVNVALPRMAEQFSVSLAQIQWIVTIYLLTMVALLPLMGRVSDRVGRHKIYSGGFMVFGIGSLMAALSGSLAAILAARFVQGIGATMIMANSQAMVRQIFPDHERGRALGFNAVIISVGTLSGPSVGGVLLDFVGWEGLFWLNVPLGLAGLVFGLKLFPNFRQQVSGNLDWIGTALLSAGTAALVLAAEFIAQEGLSQRVTLYGAAGLGLLTVFALYEIRLKDGIMDRELFGRKIVALGNFSAFLIHLVQMAALIPITFYFMHELALEPWLTGLALSLQPLFMGIVAPLGGWYRDRYGAFVPLFVGPLAGAVSMMIVVFAGVSPFAMAFHLALFGIAMGFFQATNNAEIMSNAPDNKLSHAGSMLALIRYVGMIAGTGLAAAFAGTMGAGGSASGAIVEDRLRLLFALCFVFCLVVTALAFLRRNPRAADRRLSADRLPADGKGV